MAEQKDTVEGEQQGKEKTDGFFDTLTKPRRSDSMSSNSSSTGGKPRSRGTSERGELEQQERHKVHSLNSKPAKRRQSYDEEEDPEIDEVTIMLGGPKQAPYTAAGKGQREYGELSSQFLQGEYKILMRKDYMSHTGLVLSAVSVKTGRQLMVYSNPSLQNAWSFKKVQERYPNLCCTITETIPTLFPLSGSETIENIFLASWGGMIDSKNAKYITCSITDGRATFQLKPRSSTGAFFSTHLSWNNVCMLIYQTEVGGTPDKQVTIFALNATSPGRPYCAQLSGDPCIRTQTRKIVFGKAPPNRDPNCWPCFIMTSTLPTTSTIQDSSYVVVDRQGQEERGSGGNLGDGNHDDDDDGLYMYQCDGHGNKWWLGFDSSGPCLDDDQVEVTATTDPMCARKFRMDAPQHLEKQQ